MTTPDIRPTLHPNYRPPSPLITLQEFLAVADNLTEAGHDVGPELQKIEAIQRAAWDAIKDEHRLPDDLLAADPDDIARRLRHAALNRASKVGLADYLNGFETTLARSAAAALAARSDALVAAMRKGFDKALKVVAAARDAGLTPGTDGAMLADAGSPEQIAAFRELPAAVAALEHIAGLRSQLTTVVGVGPVDHPVAAFVTDVPSLLHLEGAGNVWRGEHVWEQKALPLTGAHLHRVPAKRLGGPWLALLNGGYTVRLNTGDEAHAVVTAVREGR